MLLGSTVTRLSVLLWSATANNVMSTRNKLTTTFVPFAIWLLVFVYFSHRCWIVLRQKEQQIALFWSQLAPVLSVLFFWFRFS